MVRKIDAFWRPPQFENIELTWRARPTYLMARSLLLITLVTALAAGLLPPNRPAGPMIGLTIAFILLLSMVLVRRGHVGLVNWAMPGLVLLAVMTALWLGYLPVDLALAVTVITVAIGSFMTSLLGGILFGTAASVVMSLALFLHPPSRLDVTGLHSPALESLIYVFLLLATILLVRLMDRVMWSGYREWRLQATMLERANKELAITIDSMQVQSASLAKANRDLQSEIVERRQAQQLLRAVVDGTAAATGADFMRSLVKYLAEALAVPYVFVGEALDLDPCRVRALAFWNDGMPGPLFEYCVPGTPCQEVVSRGETLYIPEGVRELYPEDMDLVEMRCDGYFGTPLVTMGGGIIGNLVLMDRIPLRLDEQKQSLVKVFAARASAELERQHAEAALELERSLLSQRVDERTAELRMLNTELSRVSQRKDEFLASMSHDLRTPLNSVIGMAESLQDGVYGPINERQLKAAQVVEVSGRHLLELINDVLDVSKIEAGQMILTMGDVDVDALCRACLVFVGAAAQHKRISIDYACGSDVSVLVADERRLKQVLINLLGNAVKFTDDGGQVGLQVQYLPEMYAIEFEVWDNGIGIAPQHIDRLFRPFVQIESGLNRKQGGTGLGLSIVKRLVEMHGGTVAVTSQEGIGSRFTVILPTGVTDHCLEAPISGGKTEDQMVNSQ